MNSVVARVAAALAVAGVVACFGGRLPARELYRLRPAPDAGSPRAAATDGVAPGDRGFAPVTVEPYATEGVYAGTEIVYRVGETRYGTYPTREWAVPLGTMLASLTAGSLRAVPGGVGDVHDGTRAGGRRGFIWRGTVREFEEVDREDGPREGRVAAVVRLDAELDRATDDSVLWQGSAQARRVVMPAQAMTAVVDSLASSAHAAIAELVRTAAPTLRSPAVQRAVAGRRAP